MSNNDRKVTEIIEKHERPTINPLVFYIRGMNDIVLDVYHSQARAIKVFILEYKDKVANAHICMVRNGIQYKMIPNGSAHDYMKS